MIGSHNDDFDLNLNQWLLHFTVKVFTYGWFKKNFWCNPNNTILHRIIYLCCSQWFVGIFSREIMYNKFTYVPICLFLVRDVGSRPPSQHIKWIEGWRWLQLPNSLHEFGFHHDWKTKRFPYYCVLLYCCNIVYKKVYAMESTAITFRLNLHH